jgi:hypothetical protein
MLIAMGEGGEGCSGLPERDIEGQVPGARRQVRIPYTTKLKSVRPNKVLRAEDAR